MRKVLTIDGGGIKGVFAAALLADIEETLGEPIVDYFDLIAGTSTGGIIALGLGLGLPARDILRFYEEYGPKIFRQGKLGKAGSLFNAKYGQDALANSLREVFGQSLLGDCKTRILIPSLDSKTGEVHIFKTAHHERFVRDYKVEAVSVALATAAAPFYFPSHRLDSGIELIDGGMWVNNPMGVAATESIGLLAWGKGDIRLLGIGCTQPLLEVNDKKRRRGHGLTYWAKRAAKVAVAAQSSSSIGTAQILLGHENVQRISPVVEDGRFKLDGISRVPELRAFASKTSRSEYPKLVEQFFGTKAEPFIPYRTN